MTVAATTVPVLTFHALDGRRASVASLLPAVFERGIGKLCANGYSTIDLMEAVACLRQRRPFPRRAVVITFDDGYESAYQDAFPVLQRHGLCATFFLTTGKAVSARHGGRLPSFNGRAMLSWAQIREMHGAGHTFGAHTLTHPDLTLLSPAHARSEICGSKKIIEDALGVAVASFAYPYGRRNSQVRDIVAEHFSCACSDRLGMFDASSDVYAIERADAYCLRKWWGFDVMPTRLFPWYLHTYRILRQMRMAIGQ